MKLPKILPMVLTVFIFQTSVIKPLGLLYPTLNILITFNLIKSFWANINHSLLPNLRFSVVLATIYTFWQQHFYFGSLMLVNNQLKSSFDRTTFSITYLKPVYTGPECTTGLLGGYSYATLTSIWLFLSFLTALKPFTHLKVNLKIKLFHTHCQTLFNFSIQLSKYSRHLVTGRLR